MLIQINKRLKRLRTENGGIAFFVATLAAWIFLIGFSVDFGRTLVVKRTTYIQLDHALKAGAKQIDEEHLADQQIVILEDKAEEVFSETLAEGLGLNNSYPYFSPDENTAFAGDLEVISFEVLNYGDPAHPEPIADPVESGVEFQYPTCHAIIQVPIETVLWKMFGVDTITFTIHADASNEIIIS